MDFNQSLEYVDRLVKSGELDRAEAMLDEQIAKARRKLRDTSVDDTWSPAATDDNGDENDDDEETSTPVPKKTMKAWQDDEADEAAKALDTLDRDIDRITKVSEAPRGYPLRQAALEATMDQIEAERIEKLGRLQPVRYPHGTDTDLNDHQNLQHEGTTTVFADRSQRTVTPVVQPPGRHPFDDLVDEVRARDGGSRMAAMTRARLDNPEVWSSYQRWRATGTAQSQQTAQGDTSSQFNKQEPLTFEAAVSREIVRGCPAEVAAQRVVNRYGSSLPRENFSKGATDIEMQFLSKADDYIDPDSAMPRTEAMRAARIANKRLFKMLQSAR